ncbi:MAG TPA: hypothetical protein VE983_12830 [Solirubrobacteraceae bacterium]|nr:hypothetical protein [Solirubrobacteraceae bacterium]
MTDQRPSEVLGALPRTRPERRSSKRPQRQDVQAASQVPAPSPAAPSAAAGARARTRTAESAATEAKARARTTESAAAKAKARPRPTKTAAARGPARPGAGRTKRGSPPLRQPPQPRGIPSQPRAPVPPHRPEILGTAVQAAAELAEIGLALSTRALRRAVSRIPRP